jgi:hypothetical protein
LNLGTISELFGSYGRTARLYPGVIFLLPLLWHLPLLSGSVTVSLPESVGAAAIGSAALYLIAVFARHRGKVAEPKLIARWGGWPTSIMLRHRDGRVDHLTKARYHAQLAKLSGVVMPSAEEEQQQPAHCEAAYRSATKVLLEARRDDSNALLHKENAAYGFRRNLYGLRGFALGMTGLLLIVTVGVWLLQFDGPATATGILAALKADKAWAVAVVLDLIYLVFYWLVVTPDFVFQSGTDYAGALLRTLDKPAS